MSNDLQESQNIKTRFGLYKRQAEEDLKRLGVTIVDTVKEEYEGSDTEWDDVVDVINKAIRNHASALTVPFPLLEAPEKKKFMVAVSYEIPVEAFTEDEAEEIAAEELDGTISIGEGYCEASDYFDLSVEHKPWR